jgi:hypothetical protein
MIDLDQSPYHRKAERHGVPMETSVVERNIAQRV